ncbi:hypothetical protein [Blastopirellula marina]|uniref:Uncharacterized protein n=1 Tax=Blastopirellula marina TaxID=124 RepID=A0A2S8FWN3_9BACT|nr:hypothetical protein [Blastopirellula marina]PQO36592.1 hypothetical protein C5Y98_11390 [Blastopirellula marina]PTL44422.1 hypothetical protein C5Y97_11400 [Blastopirellula marina]
MNSELTTIRSLIVLLFLIGLPVVAIMPEGVQGALKGFLPEGKSDSSTAPIPPVRSSDELASFPVLSTNPPTMVDRDRLPPATRLASYETTEPHGAASHISPVQPTRWETPAQVAASTGAPSSFAPPQTDPIDDLPLPSDRLMAPRMPSTGMVNENTTDLQAELDRLGATYTRLESWGNTPRVYRFHCTVTIKIGLAEYSRRFESTAESPESAMQEVRDEVQAWHDRFSDSDHSYELNRHTPQPL